MKPFLKIAVISLFLPNIFFAAAQVFGGNFTPGVPDTFAGVWEKDDRFVMFAQSDGVLNSNIIQTLSDQNMSAEEKLAAQNEAEYISILLKTFYGWYLDRTAEPASFAAEKRILNDSTCPEAEHIRVAYRPLLREENTDPLSNESESSVWELFIRYPTMKDSVIVPVAIIGGNLYLNFAIKLNVAQAERTETEELVIESLDEAADNDDSLLGFWCSLAPTDGIKVALPIGGENIYSTYITEDAVYTIRYWRTDMNYTNEAAFFSDGGKRYSVVKHIQSGGKVFSCTNGRSVTIRNVQKTNDRPQVYELNSSATICGFGEPYLKRVQNENSVQAVVALVQKAMSRKAPNPDPPFPPSNLDFHMDEIYRLEEGNLIIQSLRERGKKWGNRQ